MAMSTGLLILCSPLPQLHHRLGGLLTAAASHVTKTLYVQLEPRLTSQWRPPDADNTQASPPAVADDPDYVRHCARFISRFYARCYSSTATGALDVRFCVAGLRRPDLGSVTTRRDLEVVMTDVSPARLHHDVVREYLEWRFARRSPDLPKILSISEEDDVLGSSGVRNGESVEAATVDEGADDPSGAAWRSHQRVVLGGTFDRLHSGHKILLNDAVLRCTERLTIGICVGPMIAHKKLSELIEPFDVRETILRDFLVDVDGNLEYQLVPIVDPFGPAIEDPSLQGIVVSRETVAGGKKVNEKRIARGMNVLDLYVVDLVADPDHCSQEEEKISSSSLRMRTLGNRRDRLPRCHSALPERPYVIGLTGGIASGKSSIGRRLKTLGATVVDCDKLGHAAYAQGSPAYRKIVAHFGTDVVSENGDIDRRALGGKVFGSKTELDILNGIVWPDIRRMVKELIEQAGADGVQVVIVEAAVLLEAGWDVDVHELWVAIIPEDEAVRRIQSRNGLEETQARQRISRQMSNSDRLASANVVFCSLWEPEYTISQVEKAWTQLQSYLKVNDHNSKM